MAAEDKSKEINEEEVQAQVVEDEIAEEEQIFPNAGEANNNILNFGGIEFKKIKTEIPIEKIITE